MTINVSKDAERTIDAAVQSGQFASADQMIDQLVREYAQHAQARSTAAQPLPSATPTEKPIWEVMDELRRSVPPEEFAKLPVDGASQHDHYIYGTPKRPTR
jgi:Arc/MetJ-type ribon-helix-helix transcriptional regulator